MSLIPLIAHSSAPAPAVRGLAAEAVYSGGNLHFRFVLEGDLNSLRIPEASDCKRTDNLWRRTCFEAFLKSDGSDGYLEFNFSPSGEWAAYCFSGYREGMREAATDTPILKFEQDGGRAALRAAVKCKAPEAAVKSSLLQIALSAVIEADDGSISYWALAHPSPRPDFHHPLSFAHILKRDA